MDLVNDQQKSGMDTRSWQSFDNSGYSQPETIYLSNKQRDKSRSGADKSVRTGGGYSINWEEQPKKGVQA